MQDLPFWLTYLTNGKHLAWYASIHYTLIAALLGGAVALLLGLVTAAASSSRIAPIRLLASAYITLIRGVPDVLFFLFFPIAFEMAIEWLRATQVCGPDAVTGIWPPCDAANLRFGTLEYLLLASASLGIVYGAFAGSIVAGALRAVPRGQLEAARAFGMSRLQVLLRIHVRQMWVYALPGLSNVWMSLIKATSLLSLLQILDIVALAHRLGAANYSAVSGLVHDDWRAGYYFALLVFYLALTWLSEKAFAALTRRASRGMAIAGERA